MKTILAAILALIGLSGALAGQQFDAGTWKNVQTYDVPTLLKQENSLLGKIVGVRFHYRSEKLRHIRPNWYEASIWQNDPKAKKGYSGLRVIVPKADVPDFKTITFDFNSFTDTTLYARIEKDEDNNVAQLRLLGSKVTKDAAGNVTVGW